MTSRTNSGAPLTDVGKFHAVIQQMFDALEKSFPDDDKLPYYKDKLMLAKKGNARLTVEKFLETVEQIHSSEEGQSGAVPIFEHIMREDEDFFLNNLTAALDDDDKDAANELAANCGVVDSSSDVTSLMNKIMSLWNGMTANSRVAMWRFFKSLVTLSIMVTKRQDLVIILNKYRDIPLKL